MADFTTSILVSLRDAFSAPLKQMKTGLSDVNNQLKVMKSSFSLAADLNQASQSAGKFGTTILGALKPAASEFIGFEKAMSGVAAMTNEIGSPAFKQMRDLAMQLGSATQFSAKEAADAMGMFGQQGLTANQILAATPQALNLAAAGMLGIAESADIMGVAMAGMAIPADQTAHVVDALAFAANAANTDVRGIGEAFKYVGPNAHDAGMSLELTVAMIGKLSDAGIKGTAAGTGLRAVLARLESPAKQVVKSMREFGFSGEAIKKMQKDIASGHIDVALKKFAELGAKLPDEKRLRLMSDIFGAEASTAASVLVTASVDVSPKGLEALSASLRSVDGYASRTAGILNDNLAGELERTGGALSELSLRIGENLRPSLMQTAGAVQGLVGGLVSWTEQNPELANSLVRVAALTGGGALALKGFLEAGSTLASGLEIATKGTKLFMDGVSGLAGILADLPATLKAVQGGFFLVQGAIAAQGGLMAATKAFTLSIMGPAAAVLAVGALSYALAAWANDAFGISDKLAEAVSWVWDGKSLQYDKTDNPNLDPLAVQQYGDGTKRDGKTGKILELGTKRSDLAPKDVREARAAGAVTVDQINDFIAKRKEQEKAAAVAAPVPAPAAVPGGKAAAPAAPTSRPVPSAPPVAAPPVQRAPGAPAAAPLQRLPEPSPKTRGERTEKSSAAAKNESAVAVVRAVETVGQAIERGADREERTDREVLKVLQSLLKETERRGRVPTPAARGLGGF